MTWSSLKSFTRASMGKNMYLGDNNWTQDMGTFHQFSIHGINDQSKKVNFAEFAGKVLLVTNVACKCSFTAPSYTQMEQYSSKYGEQGFRILCFPCNQFFDQEPWTEEEIQKYVNKKWQNLNAQMFTKIDVNGDNTHAIYKYLKTCFPGEIAWNFATKFIIGKNGIPVQRFDKNQKWEDIESCFTKELAKDVSENNDNNHSNDNTQLNTTDTADNNAAIAHNENNT